jgi:O-antigen/teichoic acid export membrane protein
VLKLNVFQQAIDPLRTRLVNNPDYTKSVLSGYLSIAVNIIVQIILVPIYLHYLGKPTFGVLVITVATINYLTIGVGWASSGILRIMGEYSAHHKIDELNDCYAVSKTIFIGYASLSGILILGGLWLLQDLWQLKSSLGNREIYEIAVISVAYIIIYYDFNVDRLTLIATGHQAKANLLTIVSQIVFFVGVIPVLITGGGISEILMMLLVGILMTRLVSWYYLRRQNITWLKKRPTNKESFKRILGKMGLGYILYGVLFMVLIQGDVIVIGWLGNATLVADFVLVWKIADVVVQILWRIPETLVPYLIQMDARNEFDQLKKIYREGQRWIALPAFLSGILFAIFGPYVVEIWVGRENAPDNHLAYILAGGAIFWLANARLAAIFAYSLLKLRELNYILGLELVCKTVLTIILFPITGIMAPMIAINITHICGVAYLYRRLGRKTLESLMANDEKIPTVNG